MKKVKDMLIKITCNNCGDIAVFDVEYMTPKRKKIYDCYICRNNNKKYYEKSNFLKKDGVICNDLKAFFGKDKGFKFEKIKEEEFEKIKESVKR